MSQLFQATFVLMLLFACPQTTNAGVGFFNQVLFDPLFKVLSQQKKPLFCASLIANSASHLGTLTATKSDAIAAALNFVKFRRMNLRDASEESSAQLKKVFYQKGESRKELLHAIGRMRSMEGTLSFLRGETRIGSNLPQPIRVLSIEVSGEKEIKEFLSEVRIFQTRVSKHFSASDLYRYQASLSEEEVKMSFKIDAAIRKIGLDPQELQAVFTSNVHISDLVFSLFGGVMFANEIYFLSTLFQFDGLVGQIKPLLDWCFLVALAPAVSFVRSLLAFDISLTSTFNKVLENDLRFQAGEEDFIYLGDSAWVDPQVFPNQGGVPTSREGIVSRQHAADFFSTLRYSDFLSPKRTARLLTQSDAWKSDNDSRTQVTWDLLIRRTSSSDPTPWMSVMIQDWGDPPAFKNEVMNLKSVLWERFKSLGLIQEGVGLETARP